MDLATARLDDERRPGKDDRTARYDQTRERVIDVAAQLFARNGYASTGVAQIGEAAQLAKGALYYYIESKDALLAAIHDRVMDPLLAEGKKIFELELSAPARLTLLSESLMFQIVHRRDHVRVFLHEYHQLQGESRARFHAKRTAFESYVTRLLAEGTAAGDLEVRDLRLTTLAWLNLHNYTYQWIQQESRVPYEVLSAQYCDIFFRGVGAAPSSTLDDEVQRGRRLLREG
jgi:AcrR family transcriptional regulator